MRHADNEKICKFVKHLQKDFPHLVQSFCNDSEMGEVNSCVACDVVEKVNVDDVIDVLLQEAVIDEDLYKKIWRCSIKKRGWNRLLKNMNHAQMSKCLSVLAKALVLKYPQICKRITKSGIKTLKCCCYNNRCSKARNRKFSKLKNHTDKPASWIGFIELRYIKRYRFHESSTPSLAAKLNRKTHREWFRWVQRWWLNCHWRALLHRLPRNVTRSL